MKTKQVKLPLATYKLLRGIRGDDTFPNAIKLLIDNYGDFKLFMARIRVLKKRIKTIRNTKNYLLVAEEKDLFIDNIIRGDIK